MRRLSRQFSGGGEGFPAKGSARAKASVEEEEEFSFEHVKFGMLLDIQIEMSKQQLDI